MNLHSVFAQILNMSLTASAVILVVLVLRWLLRRLPKALSYALWAVVLFRLLCPISFSSQWSVLGLVSTPAQQTQVTQATSSMQYLPAAPSVPQTPQAPPVQPETTLPNTAPVQPLPTAAEKNAPMDTLAWLWLAGVVGLVGYSAVSYFLLRKKLTAAMPLRENIYLADHLSTPFVVGLVRPRIYLPSDLPESQQGYILCHERYHLRRGDHWIKLLAFAALCLHWFNPLVWLAFFLAASDMEMSCDEAVVRRMGGSIRADYSASLLSLATGRHIIAGSPLAFGEGSTKSRIHNLARYKKPALWALGIGVVLCVIAAVALLSNPQGSSGLPQPGSLTVTLDVGTFPSYPQKIKPISSAEKAPDGVPEISLPNLGIPAMAEAKLVFHVEDPSIRTLHLTENYNTSPLGPSSPIETTEFTLEREPNGDFVFLPEHKNPANSEEAFYTVEAEGCQLQFALSLNSCTATNYPTKVTFSSDDGPIYTQWTDPEKPWEGQPDLQPNPNLRVPLQFAPNETADDPATEPFPLPIVVAKPGGNLRFQTEGAQVFQLVVDVEYSAPGQEILTEQLHLRQNAQDDQFYLSIQPPAQWQQAGVSDHGVAFYHIHGKKGEFSFQVNFEGLSDFLPSQLRCQAEGGLFYAQWSHSASPELDGQSGVSSLELPLFPADAQKLPTLPIFVSRDPCALHFQVDDPHVSSLYVTSESYPYTSTHFTRLDRTEDGDFVLYPWQENIHFGTHALFTIQGEHGAFLFQVNFLPQFMNHEVSAPDPDAPKLTEESAGACLQQTLESLSLNESQQLSFTIPDHIPADGNNSYLYLSLSASYRLEDGSMNRIELLDNKISEEYRGRTFLFPLKQENAELVQYSMRASIRLPAMATDENSTGHVISDFAVNYIEQNAPFQYGVSPMAHRTNVQISADGLTNTLTYDFSDSTQTSLQCALPQGLSLQQGAPSFNMTAPPSVNILQGDTVVGTLELYELGTTDPEDLRSVDTSANTLPMQIFAAVALSNHCDYTDYTVVQHSKTGAAATAVYTWQDLDQMDQYGAAVEIPFEETATVLAYDWDASPYFVELRFDKDFTLSEKDLTALAKSIRILS